MKSNDTQEMENLVQEISLIFKRLHSKTSEESDKEEIINIVMLKMQRKTLTHFDIANSTIDLVIMGYS
ncbi:hypothetical protein [Chryseobacterium indoltheticum]|uniref:hypothetical protein n=1 Tax=Chryseobacterium indoltheticum TaxID=254 RepID=UPI003F4912BD